MVPLLGMVDSAETDVELSQGVLPGTQAIV